MPLPCSLVRTLPRRTPSTRLPALGEVSTVWPPPMKMPPFQPGWRNTSTGLSVGNCASRGKLASKQKVTKVAFFIAIFRIMANVNRLAANHANLPASRSSGFSTVRQNIPSSLARLSILARRVRTRLNARRSVYEVAVSSALRDWLLALAVVRRFCCGRRCVEPLGRRQVGRQRPVCRYRLQQSEYSQRHNQMRVVPGSRLRDLRPGHCLWRPAHARSFDLYLLPQDQQVLLLRNLAGRGEGSHHRPGHYGQRQSLGLFQHG